jgi:hypothetical protein
MELLEAMKSGDSRELEIETAWPEDVPSADAEAGDPYPLEGKTVWFTAKKSRASPDADALIQKTSEAGGGIEVDPTDTNIAYVTIDSADTEGISTSDGLYCDVQVKNEADKVFTVWEGRLPIDVDVTQSTSL